MLESARRFAARSDQSYRAGACEPQPADL